MIAGETSQPADFLLLDTAVSGLRCLAVFFFFTRMYDEMRRQRPLSSELPSASAPPMAIGFDAPFSCGRHLSSLSLSPSRSLSAWVHVEMITPYVAEETFVVGTAATNDKTPETT